MRELEEKISSRRSEKQCASECLMQSAVNLSMGSAVGSRLRGVSSAVLNQQAAYFCTPEKENWLGATYSDEREIL